GASGRPTHTRGAARAYVRSGTAAQSSRGCPLRMATVIATGLVDCDIHNTPASDARLRPYLPERWRRHLERFGARARHGLAQGFPYPKATPGAARLDAAPPGGGPGGPSLAVLAEP